MWKDYEDSKYNVWESHYLTKENFPNFPIIVIKKIEENNYKIMIKAKSSRMYAHNTFESSLEVAKLKGILRAKDLGWNITKVM